MKHIVIAVAAVSVLLVSESAYAQEQTTGQQQCINTLNKDAAKVFSTQGKEAGKCMKNFAKGKGSAAACIAADAKQKVAGKKQKTLDDEANKCGEAPDFATGSAGLGADNANAAGVEKALWLAYELFGETIDAGTITNATSKEQAGCQQGVLKAVQKCVNRKIKEFNKCKKLGLAGKSPPGLIDSAQDLEDLCFQAIIDDAKGKVAKACAGVTGKGIDGALLKKCTNKGVTGAALEAAFSAVAPPVTSSAIDIIAECEACLYLNAVDGLNRDCDLFDDTLPNGSCSLCLEIGDLVAQGIPSEVCVLPSIVSVAGADVDICPVSNCAGGSVGCPVSITTDAINTNVMLGTATFQGDVDASGFRFDVTFLFATDNCTATTATADVTVDIEVDYISGGAGTVIVDAITNVTVTVSNETIVISGGTLCSLADFVSAVLLPTLTAQIEAAVSDLVTSTLLGQELCLDAGFALCSNLSNPTPECGVNMTCFPTGSGIAVCVPQSGAGSQGAICVDSSECAPELTCVSTGPNNECLQWCKTTADCPGFTVCTSLVPPISVDGQQWGVCF